MKINQEINLESAITEKLSRLFIGPDFTGPD
jgi:hypothetical protein